MNPFLNTSLPELRAMVPGLRDAELDALCAAACDGEWVIEDPDFDPEWCCEGERFWMADPRRCVLHWVIDAETSECLISYAGYWPPVLDYTSDGREAMRLLVKYRLNVRWGQDFHYGVEYLSVQPDLDSDLCTTIKDIDPMQLLCRLTAEAACIAALDRTIEGVDE